MKNKIYESLLNLIFPKTCGYCEEITTNGSYICNRCIGKYKYDFENKCRFCGKTTYNEGSICNECSKQKIYYKELLYITYYEDIIKQRITEYKFFEKKYLSHFFAEIIIKNLEIINSDLIMPVPIGKKRKRERGYNQSELIAKEIAEAWNIDFDKTVLRKIKETPKQSKLKLNERRKNIKNAFEVIDSEKVKGKKIILFDDIFTTGATVNEISRVLRKSGVSDIIILVLARAKDIF